MSYPLFHPLRLGDLPMVLTEEEFAAAFPGEGEFVELKQGVSSQRVQETAVSFSNADGGVLIAGVAPDGRIVGVAQTGERTKDVHQALREVRNPGRYDVRELQVGSSRLLVVSVDRRREGFSQTSSGAVLVRRGASNVALLGAELSRFLSRRSFETFELTPTTATVNDAPGQLVARLAVAFGWATDGDVGVDLQNAGLAVVESGHEVLTVAGTLLLLPDPAAIGGRPYIDVRRYSGDEPDPDKTWEVRGPVDHQVEEATRSILEELGSVSAIVGVQRVDMPKLPQRVLREAIANAVAHRSYEHVGSAIRVEIRPTQVTITSPGVGVSSRTGPTVLS